MGTQSHERGAVIWIQIKIHAWNCILNLRLQRAEEEASSFTWTIGSWRTFIVEIKPLFPDSIDRTLHVSYGYISHILCQFIRLFILLNGHIL